jgi:CYTH domain-containing protein
LKDVYVPDTDGTHPRLRLRKKGDRYEITKKIPVNEGDASAHTELTIPLDEQEFLALEKSSHKFVEKDRYKVTIDGHEAEVDVFQGELKGLVVIDFEFESEADMTSFVTPAVCLADVTQENFIAGGLLAGKSYADISSDLDRFNYVFLGE